MKRLRLRRRVHRRRGPRPNTPPDIPRVNVVGTRRGGSGPRRSPQRPLRRRARRRRLDGRSVRRRCARRADLRPRRVRHEGGHRGGALRGGSDPSAPASGCPGRSRSAARWTKRAAASPASRGWRAPAELRRAARISSIIPEPLNVDRICIGHRGVYWFEVTTRGRIAHGSMPFLGISAIDGMGTLLQRVREELMPALATRTTAVPVVPVGRPPSDDQRERRRRRTAGRRHSDAVRRRHVPRGVRSAILARRGIRADQNGNRTAGRARRGGGAWCPLRSARSDGRASDAHAGRLAA